MSNIVPYSGYGDLQSYGELLDRYDIKKISVSEECIQKFGPTINVTPTRIEAGLQCEKTRRRVIYIERK